MVEVKLNKSNSNPFYGLKNCLTLFKNMNSVITTKMLDDAYNEVKDNKQNKELFYSLLFSVGDITNREHNIFNKIKVDNGGNANRESFEVIFNWLLNTNRRQFKKFLFAGLFNEYTCFDLLFKSRVKTKGTKVTSTTCVFQDKWYFQTLLEYVYSIINGTNHFNKFLVAKFLTIPRLSRRTKHSKMLEETKTIMEAKAKFLVELSKLMNWEYQVEGTYANFKGYRQWRKGFNESLESVLFSTGKIFDLSKDEFLNWFDKLPAQARFRTKNKILYSKNADETFKYPKLQVWYKEWEEYKTKKQAEQRVLEEKVRQGQASEEDKIKLEKVKKEAKVTVGATNFNDIYNSILTGKVDELKVESFMNKVNLPYNSLVILDDSGSMSGAPFNFASFIAAACLVKNPDDEGRNLLGFFDDYSHWYGYIDKQTSDAPNNIFRKKVTTIKKEPFVNPKLSFMDNYRRIASFCNATFKSGCTDISAIPEGLHKVCSQFPEVLDTLKNYPVWTIVSDGEWNNLYSPEASINDFFRRCENYFGFKPFIVAIDVATGWNKDSLNPERFSGIDNMIYIPSNPAMIEQFLTNFKDMEVFDIYTPLLSIYRSNRYELVRNNTI